MNKWARTSQYGWCLAAAALLLCGFLLAGTAYARFSSTVTREVKVAPEAAQPLCLLPQATGEEGALWQMTEDGACQRTFSLQNFSGSNTASRDMTVELTLLASLGVGSPEALDITLTEKTVEQVSQTAEDGSSSTVEQERVTVYRGVPTAIGEDSALAGSFGPGWCYRFRLEQQDAEGKPTAALPAEWHFTGGSQEQHLLTLRITAKETPPYDCWFRLTAAASDP